MTRETIDDVVKPTFASRLFYEFVFASAMTAFTLGFSLRYKRNRNTPKDGPILVICNHQSFMDPPIVAMGFERHLVYLARKSLFKNPLFRALIVGLNAVPIDQDSVGKDGIRITLNQLALGRPVLVFPEGTRTPDGRIHPFSPGIHLILRRMDAPIVPVGLAGVYDAWPSWRKYPIPSPLFLPPSKRTLGLYVGEPLDAKKYAAMDRGAAMVALGEEIAKVHEKAERLRRK